MINCVQQPGICLPLTTVGYYSVNLFSFSASMEPAWRIPTHIQKFYADDMIPEMIKGTQILQVPMQLEKVVIIIFKGRLIINQPGGGSRNLCVCHKK